MEGTTTIATINDVVPYNISAGSMVSYTLQTPFALDGGKTYSLTAIIRLSTDQNRNNDTLRTSFTTTMSPAPAGVGEICANTTRLRANNPNSALNYMWYQNNTDPFSFARGSNVTTGLNAANNTFYLETGARGTVGLATKDIYPNGGAYNTGGFYMNYNAESDVILENARMFVRWPGQVEILVGDVNTSTGTMQIISSTIVDVHATSPTPIQGVSNYDAADTGAVFNLNIILPSGSHSILIRSIGNTTIFRNNNVTGNPYPFVIPNLFQITGNGQSSFQSFYYYLYNMRIRSVECVSNRIPIVPTTISTPVITQQGDSLVSTVSTNVQWLLNGNGITGATLGTFKPTQNGVYSIRVSGALGCQQVSNTINFTTTSVVNVPASEIQLAVAPNPTDGNFSVQFKVTQRNDLVLQLVNAQGQTVFSKLQPKFTGTFTENFNLKNLAAGIYVLRIQHGDKVYTKKLVVQ
jgi:hypothetical protein